MENQALGLDFLVANVEVVFLDSVNHCCDMFHFSLFVIHVVDGIKVKVLQFSIKVSCIEFTFDEMLITNDLTVKRDSVLNGESSPRA